MILRNALLYIVGFTLARGSLFLAPILLANALPLEAYGVIELAQSVAALAALIVGLGLPASAPLIHLRDEVTARWDTLLWLVLVLSAAALGMAGVAAIVLDQRLSLWILVPLTVGLLLTQGLWSATLKSRGKGSSALFLEAGFWLAAVAGALLSVGLQIPTSLVALMLGLYALALWGVTFRAYVSQSGGFGLADLKENIHLATPLMVVSLLSLLAVSCGRMILGATSTIENVGIYGVLFRATVLPLVGHQMLIVGFFRQLFVWDVSVIELRAPLIPLAVFSFVVFFWSLSGVGGWMLGARFVEVFSNYRIEGLAILSQTLLWSGIALNDLLNTRLQIAGYVSRFGIIVLLTCLIVFTSIMFFISTGTPQNMIKPLVIGHNVVLVLYYAAQCIATSRQGYFFWRTWLAVAICYSLSIAAIVFLEVLA